MFFDKFFDFDGDGQLDCLEKGARDAFVINMMTQTEQESESDYADELEDPFR